MKNVEDAIQGLLQSKGFSGLPLLFERPAERMRWYLWHGKVMTAATILRVLHIDCDRLHAETRQLQEAAKPGVWTSIPTVRTTLTRFLTMSIDTEMVSQFHRLVQKAVLTTSGTLAWASGARDGLCKDSIASPSHGLRSLTGG